MISFEKWLKLKMEDGSIDGDMSMDGGVCFTMVYGDPISIKRKHKSHDNKRKKTKKDS